ncbi:hypothetical protein JST97_31625 [bacterium]|nr:hypothetical protein [bacterium]
MSEELQRYLEQQQAEGRFFESSQFSLDSLRARTKLARFQLPLPGLWLVKLVQAAVVLKADQVQVRFGNRRLEVHFSPEETLEADQILHEVLSGALPASKGLLHLVTGLRSSGAELTETVSWSSGSSSVTLRSDGSEIRAWEGQGITIQATRPVRSRSLGSMLASPVSHLARQTLEDHDCLTERCWTCPIPVYVDGRLLNNGYYSPHSRGRPKSVWNVLRGHLRKRNGLDNLQACLAVRHLEDIPGRPGLPVLSAPAEKPQVQTTVYSNQVFLTTPFALTKAAGVITVEFHREARSEMNFVWDGAVVSTTCLDLAPPAQSFLGIRLPQLQYLAIRCIVGVRRSELDLSQFQLINQEALAEELIGHIKPDIQELLKDLLRLLGHFHYSSLSPLTQDLASKALLSGPAVGAVLLTAGAGTEALPFFFFPGLIAAAQAANELALRQTIKMFIQRMLRRMDQPV